MNAIFETIYNTEVECRRNFADASKLNDVESMNKVASIHTDLMNRVKEAGHDFRELYKLYEDAHDNGREDINIVNCPYEQDARLLVDAFHKYGVERFTFGSTWSSSAEIAWIFCENGYKVTGMEMVVTNANAIDYEGKPAPEMKPAYIFEKA